MRAPFARWNPAPDSCYWAKKTPKSAVCYHRMVGWSSYMRNFEHLRDGRYISAHFTIDWHGYIEQHVDTDHAAFTQGLSKDRYGVCKWPLFRNRNPNLDVIGIELEDKGNGFTDDHPMSEEQLASVVRLNKWLFNSQVVRGRPQLGTTVIGHSLIDPKRRPNDPGNWFWEHVGPRLIPQRKTAPKSAEDLEIERDVRAMDQRLRELESRIKSIQDI